MKLLPTRTELKEGQQTTSAHYRHGVINSMTVNGFILAAAFFALVTLVAKSPNRFVYDEPYFSNYISLFHQHGFTPKFLNSLNAAPGPLSAIVQAIFEPLTHLRPVAMRFVSVFLLLVSALVLGALLKKDGRGNWVAAASVLAVPMTWVVGGMALSEVSAMMLVTLSLYFQTKGLEALDTNSAPHGWFLTAGVFLGFAIWGRQPYLLLISVPLLLACVEPRLRGPASVFAGVAACMAVPLFSIWGGFVPPSQHLSPGFSILHALLSFGYTGFCFILLGARSNWLSWKAAFALVGLTILTNGTFRAFAIFPVKSLVDRHVNPAFLPFYGNACGSLFLSCGVLSLAILIRIIWESRIDRRRLMINTGLLCVVAAPLLDTHQYSSRYTAMALPYIVLAANPWQKWSRLTTLTTLAGCVLGYLSLSGYFNE
ncbi:hypothetical protein G7B40_041905 [Aetokthonos hydrillicola Thurmond2011]|uniref:Glycosyltransferase RgtA/B/C/D-like domain-containing protein n=1 Tax=Aetokthonos hydrillicola Thurmond2011 TaxID=2712845 RepID=A0AAP5MD55_9CYAN|nr:hypothetical protein [Aetokthonos hydrillicola]MDR9900965.1 hypothetical protein [Aetokthonos hydrillicola Thurmond2011]